jgi:hypothetical protein
MKLNYSFTVPYVNAAAAAMLYQYPPVYGRPPVMYPSMAVLQPATTLLQAPGSQPSIPVSATCKQENKVGQQCNFICVYLDVSRLALRTVLIECTLEGSYRIEVQDSYFCQGVLGEGTLSTPYVSTNILFQTELLHISVLKMPQDGERSLRKVSCVKVLFSIFHHLWLARGLH